MGTQDSNSLSAFLPQRGENGQVPLSFVGKVFPYTRMTRRSKGYNPRAISYLENQHQIRASLAEQWGPFAPLHRSLEVSLTACIFVPSLITSDGDNLYKSILDSCKGVILSDDRYVTHGEFIKIQSDTYGFRASVEWTIAPWADKKSRRMWGMK